MKKRLLVLSLLNLCLILAIMPIGIIHAQLSVTITCDTTFDTDSYVFPPNFDGQIYRLIQGNTGSFLQITQSGVDTLQSPITSDFAQNLYLPIASPNGRFIAFRPRNASVGLTIWDAVTDEIASIPLTQDEIEYLSSNPNESVIENQWKLIWSSDTRLTIQYPPFERSGFFQIGTITEIILQTSPLQLQKLTPQEITYPILPLLSTSSIPSVYYLYSPQGRFVSQLTIVDNDNTPNAVLGHFQVYDAVGSTLLFDRPPDTDSWVIERPFWLPNEQGFFYIERLRQISALRLAYVQTQQGVFTENNMIWDILENEFNSSVYLDTSTFDPTISANGLSVAFEIWIPNQELSYIVLYSFLTDDLTIMCNPFTTTDIGGILPIWSPENRYFGYWNSGNIPLFDAITGEIYQIEGAGFAGWVSESE